jgi:hypothetical protein
MTAVFLNRSLDDEQRRSLLYQGHLFVYSTGEQTRALCDFARELCVEAFSPHDPRHAQHHLTQQQYVQTLADLKPKFIHHPRCKELIREILRSLGCDLRKTFFDVPRLRTATSHAYLTAGLGYVFKPHRDTWYSPPQCQLNWWLPVYDIVPENAMSFQTRYWDTPIRNSSSQFNYQNWQHGGRKEATTLIQKDTRRQSEALEPVELDNDLRIITEAGGLLIFSAAQMHATVPNTSGQTRFSIDFRTVHLDDLEAQRGAPNIDSACTGTTIHDYLRGDDFSHVPESTRRFYEQLTAAEVANRPIIHSTEQAAC